MTGLRPLRQTVPKCEWNAISLIARRESLRENKLTNNMRDQKANELTIFVFDQETAVTVLMDLIENQLDVESESAL